MSILLLLFWTLSPLGGQSSLRLLREGTHTTSEHHYVAYADRNAWSTIMLAEQSHLSYISSIMSSTIMTSTKSQSNSADLWGHPKIPRVMELELAARNNTSEAWGLPIRANNTRYTSMIGPSVTGLQPNTTITFKMPYEYLYVDCRVQFRGATEKKVREYFKSAEQDGSEIPPSWQDPNASMFTATVLSNRSNLYSYESSYFLVVTHDDKYRLEYLFYGSKDDHGTTVYACTVNSLATYVFLKCESANCLVEYMTSLREDVVGTQIVDGRASNLIRRFTWSRWFFRYLASVGGTSNAQTSHPIDNHVYGSMSVALPGDERSHPPIKFLRDWSTVADEDVSQRLTEVLNTFWETSRWVRSVVLNDPYGSSSIDPATGEPYLYLNLKRTDAILSRQFSIYKANKPWIYTLLFCSGVLFLLGFVNMIVVLQTSVPDVFGYVSSLTRDNVYMDIPDGGTTLDGSTRAKLLRNVKVQLADVKEGDRVGHLALKSFEPGVVSRSKLPWQDRLYT